MAKLSARDFLSNLKEVIIEFENEKVNEKTKNKRLGITYTPQPVVDYIVLKAIKLYFEGYLNLPEFSSSDFYYKALKQSLLENTGLKNKLIKILQSIRILDPASGSGRPMTYGTSANRRGGEAPGGRSRYRPGSPPIPIL